MSQSNNWLERQLEEAEKSYESWPSWMKEYSRTGEFVKNTENIKTSQSAPSPQRRKSMAGA